MHTSSLAFTVFKNFGFWRPIKCSSFLAIWLYNGFTIFMAFLIITSTLSELMDVILNAKTLDEFTGNCFMMMSMINVCFKTTNILMKRGQIITLINMLLKAPFKPRDQEEIEIIEKYRKVSRWIFYSYGGLTWTCIVIITIRSIVGAFEGLLLFRAWLPYNLSTPLIFWLSYFHQMIAHTAGGSTQVANECLIVGLMLDICAQLEILKHRLHRISQMSEEMPNSETVKYYKKSNSSAVIAECVEHHLHIVEFSRQINQIFYWVIFIQFSVSTVIICSSIYQLSRMPMGSAPFVSLSIYLSCMLFQVFLFCWYGNEVILQSLNLNNSVYEMDWTRLGIRERKELLIIMTRATKPIKIASGAIIRLSLSSFTQILKSSYSAFNVLQQSSH
ncbi:odorant receptor 46a-like [Belonocnema kinseyi]|uniref:odorant receptor 46a-like n=1 Tax=Belonocnema kinseyi TaxID=2817044 RepID=UPI00143D9F15|nr:odorant receptor 46a-like [Belonocnema kinseyi]